jgi:hypothetical protein
MCSLYQFPITSVVTVKCFPSFVNEVPPLFLKYWITKELVFFLSKCGNINLCLKNYQMLWFLIRSVQMSKFWMIILLLFQILYCSKYVLYVSKIWTIINLFVIQRNLIQNTFLPQQKILTKIKHIQIHSVTSWWKNFSCKIYLKKKVWWGRDQFFMSTG